MKATVEEVNKVQRRIKVEVPQTDVASAFQKIYQGLQRKAKIHGFRPGKAPLSMIKKLYSGSVAYDVVDHLVKHHLFSALDAKSIRPIAAPVLETGELPKEDHDYTFTALVDILPEYKVDGYKGLDVSYTPVVVNDDAVQREMDVLRRKYGKTKDAADDTIAKDGHITTISQIAYKDGQVYAPFHIEKVPVELGKKHVLPEMEAALYGMKSGDQKRITVKIPEDFGNKEMAGQTLECTLTLDKIQELDIPAADDEFAKDIGLENIEALRKNLKDNLEKQADQSKRQELESKVLDALSSKNTIDVPPSMIDQVIDSMVEEMRWPNDKAKESAKKDPEYRKSLRDTAKKKAQNTLILHEIIKAENLAVTDQDVEAYVLEMIHSQEGEKPDQKLIESIKKSLGPHVKESLLFTKALDFIIDQAKVSTAK